MPKKKNTEFDERMGVLLRESRIEARMTQTAIGDVLGVTFQQVQKYEWGHNGITLGNLVIWARRTGKPLSYFLDDSHPGALRRGRDKIMMIRELDGLDRDVYLAVMKMVRAIKSERKLLKEKVA